MSDNKEMHVLSIYVENHAGVLSRISGLFSRRMYNIDSLSVGETENPKISRMTIVTHADDNTFRQIQNQLAKLEDVKRICELHKDTSVELKRKIQLSHSTKLPGSTLSLL